MAVNNLGELRTLVKDWSNRTDISNSVIDSFINIAQDRANRILRLPILEGFSTITVTNNTLLLPSDYLEVYGALSELALYTKNTEEALQYEAKFKATATDLIKMAEDADWSGSTISIIPTR